MWRTSRRTRWVFSIRGSNLPFAEAAVAGQASYIITKNTAHFDFFSGNHWGIRGLTPKDCHALICGGA
jgi:hypothetical protein